MFLTDTSYQVQSTAMIPLNIAVDGTWDVLVGIDSGAMCRLSRVSVIKFAMQPNHRRLILTMDTRPSQGEHACISLME